MSTLTTHAGWILSFTFGGSLAYELYRATAKSGTSRHDSLKAFVQQLTMYAVAGAVIVGLFAGRSWAPV